MKLSAGIYFNMFHEIGYKRYLNGRDLDIVFLFHESMTQNECEKCFEDIENRTRKVLEKLTEDYKKRQSKTERELMIYSYEIKEALEEDLLKDYEIQIFVKL